MKVKPSRIQPGGRAYDDDFYLSQVDPSLCSARIVLAYLWRYHRPASVLDVGCGRGAWLKACHELGSVSLFGFDGDWNTQAMMIDEAIDFKAIDLNERFHAPHKVDLAMTLEVAEHLDPISATRFVESLALASDTVLFSAAYTGQGGVSHINEQPHSYWAGVFQKSGFVPFDLFRPALWGDDRVLFWYRQNTFLYVKQPSESYNKLVAAGLMEMTHTSFMDCIHPHLYAAKLNTVFTQGCELRILPRFIRSVIKRKARQRRGNKDSYNIV